MGLLSCIFAFILVFLLGLVYLQSARYLTDRVDRIIGLEARFLVRVGPDQIVRRFDQEIARDPLFSLGLFSPGGDRVAGDTTLRLADLPIDGRPRDAPRRAGAPPYRVLAERTPWGEILVVARDMRQVAALRHIILNVLLWSGALAAPLGLVAAITLSSRPLARVATMRLAFDAIGAGDFTRRLPITRRGDELDELAGLANRMMDEAERLMTQARTVGQGVAHELRSPLTRLRAGLDHASEAFPPDDPRRALLENCVAEADTVLARFQALLRIAALEARGRRTGFADVSLSDIVDQIHELYAPLAADLGIGLTADAGASVRVRGDRALLFEALANLLDNALKFTGRGGHVRVIAARTPRGARLEVRDDGPGIPAAERPLVTRRLHRGPAHAAVPGHGLGLGLVSAVADLHGFRLTIGDAAPGAVIQIHCDEAPARGIGGRAGA